MSKYGEKMRKRRAAVAQSEPEDEFSVLPDRALRMYFRARAGRFGASAKSYRRLKIEIPPALFGRLLALKPACFTVFVNDRNAVPLGELHRDIAAGHVNLAVYSTPFGGRMTVRVDRIEELHDVGAQIEFKVWGFARQSRPLDRRWLSTGRLVNAESVVEGRTKRICGGRRMCETADLRRVKPLRAFGNAHMPAGRETDGVTKDTTNVSRASGTSTRIASGEHFTNPSHRPQSLRVEPPAGATTNEVTVTITP